MRWWFLWSLSLTRLAFQGWLCIFHIILFWRRDEPSFTSSTQAHEDQTELTQRVCCGSILSTLDSLFSYVFGKVIYDRGRVFYKSRLVSGLLLLIRPLTAVCWPCEQALLFGFALKLLFRAQPPIKPPTATCGKLIYSPVKRNVTWTKGKTEPKTLLRSNPHKNYP